MEKAQIPFASVGELSKLIASREVSPVEVTQAYLDRIDAVDFKFNSYLTISRKEAIQAAQDAERSISSGNYLGPMHGIPVAVKDQIWTKGIRTTAGSRFFADFIPNEDATVISNLKKSGAVLLGKTNLTEFAIGAGFQRYNVPRNPWNLDRFTGSSSSGSGAATAAFLCATSLGEDTGGSVRFPASWCGLVGLRPTWGKVSRYGLMGGVWSMDTIGPISRTVEDAAITLNAIAGHDSKDPSTWTTPVPDYRQALNGDINGLRIGLITEQTHDTNVVDPEVREAVVKAASVLGEVGARVEEVSLPLSEYALVPLLIHLAVEPALKFREQIRDSLQDFLPGNRIGLLTGSILPAQAYYKAQKIRTMLRGQVLNALNRYDILMMPTIGKTAQPIDGYGKINLLRRPYLLTSTFSVATVPAISVPCGFSPEGLPIGLQLGAKPGREDLLLKVAHAYEQTSQWRLARPPTV